MKNPALLIVVAGALWGTMGLFGVALYRAGLMPIDVVTGRTVVAAVCFALLTWFSHGAIPKVTKREFIQYSAFALVGICGASGCYFAAIERIGVIRAVTLLYTYPILTMVMSRVLLKEHLDARRVLLVMMGIVCIIALAEANISETAWQDPIGVLLAISAALCVALFGIFSRFFSGERHYSVHALPKSKITLKNL